MYTGGESQVHRKSRDLYSEPRDMFPLEVRRDRFYNDLMERDADSDTRAERDVDGDFEERDIDDDDIDEDFDERDVDDDFDERDVEDDDDFDERDIDNDDFDERDVDNGDNNYHHGR